MKERSINTLINYPGLIVGSEREKKIKKFMEENAIPSLLNNGEDVLIVDPEIQGEIRERATVNEV